MCNCNNLKCKYCGSSRINKMGKLYGKKRYLCRDCKRTFREGVDNRIKYTEEQKNRCIQLYLENVGIRSIERLEGIHNSVISSWIKNLGKTVKEKLNNIANSIDENNFKKENIKVVEVDEIVTYIKKNLKMEENIHSYGLLLIFPSVSSHFADQQVKMIVQVQRQGEMCLHNFTSVGL